MGAPFGATLPPRQHCSVSASRGSASKQKMAGSTSVLIDVSGSMDGKLSVRSELTRMDVACSLAMIGREMIEHRWAEEMLKTGGQVFYLSSAMRPAADRDTAYCPLLVQSDLTGPICNLGRSGRAWASHHGADMMATFDQKPAAGLRRRVYEVVFEADTLPGRWFDLLLIWAIVASVAVVVLESVAAIRVQYGAVLTFAEWGFTLLFTAEYLI